MTASPRASLEFSLGSCWIDYLFLGQGLGGRPDGDEFYDEEGHALYGVVAETARFRDGLDLPVEQARRSKLAMTYSQESSTGCRRRLCATRVLCGRGARVARIRGDGRLASEDDLAAEDDPRQELFAEEAARSSTRSVSPRRPRATSRRPRATSSAD